MASQEKAKHDQIHRTCRVHLAQSLERPAQYLEVYPEMVTSLLRWMYRTNMPSKVRGAYRVSQFLGKYVSSTPIRIKGYPTIYVDPVSGNEQARKLFCETPLDAWNYEPHVSDILRAIVRPGDIAFDIGANIGLHSILLHGLGTKLFSFEPNPKLLPNLKKSLAPLRPQAAVFSMALSDACGTATLFIPEHGDDMASLGQWREGVSCFECEMATLDSLNLPQPDIVKCDVEGAENKVFRGAAKTLSDPERAPILVFEEHQGMTDSLGEAKEGAQQFLASLPSRYVFFLIDKETGKLERSFGNRPYWCDVLAVPACKKGRLEQTSPGSRQVYG